jgi:dihydroorotase
MSTLRKSLSNYGEFEKLSKKLLIKNAHIIDTSENLDSVMNVVIHNGIITDILVKSPANFDGEVIDAESCVLMPGFFDMHVHFREPGREDEETLESGSITAANGGFTGVACMPNTEPAIDSQEVVNFINENTKNYLVDVYPVGTVTNECGDYAPGA